MCLQSIVKICALPELEGRWVWKSKYFCVKGAIPVKSKPGYVIMNVPTNASIWHPHVYMAYINLCCLILGHSVWALIACNASMRFDLEKVHRGWWIANSLYEHLQNIPLYVVAVKFRVQQVLPNLVGRGEAVSSNIWVVVQLYRWCL